MQDRDVWVAEAPARDPRVAARHGAAHAARPTSTWRSTRWSVCWRRRSIPRGTAALAQLRIALDADLRAAAGIDVGRARSARAVKVHLGLALDLAALPARLARARGAAPRRGGARPARSRRGPRAPRWAQARELLLRRGGLPSGGRLAR